MGFMKATKKKDFYGNNLGCGRMFFAYFGKVSKRL